MEKTRIRLLTLHVATGEVLYKNYSEQFRNIHQKLPVLKSLFNEVAGLQADLQL